MAKMVKAKKRTIGAKPADSPIPDGPITRKTNILELAQQYPEALPVLIDAGLHCIGCSLSAVDTLEEGCALHGFDSETVDKLVKEMNERIRSFKK